MRKTVIISAIAILFLLLAVFLYQRIPSSPEQALSMFYQSAGPEDELMDSLILSGNSVVPLLLQEVQKKEKPRRRYIIGALGNIGDHSAIDTLTSLLKDSSEQDIFRCDALEAITLIDSNIGFNLARQYKDDPVRCLAEKSRSLLSGVPLERRSYGDALFGRHD